MVRQLNGCLTNVALKIEFCRLEVVVCGARADDTEVEVDFSRVSKVCFVIGVDAPSRFRYFCSA
jgi:hypothetical protein